DPEVLLCDEPTTGLDPAAAALLRDTLRALARANRLIVCSTHNLYEATELSDDVAVLDDGRIAHHGPTPAPARRPGERRRYRLRTDRSPRPTLLALGKTAAKDGDTWLVECANEVELASVNDALVRDHVRVFEAREAENTLEVLYHRAMNRRKGIA